MPTDTDADVTAAPPSVDCHGVSHVGRVRANNEDHFAIVALHRGARMLHTNLQDDTIARRLTRPPAHLFIAADGVAGFVGGEEASRLTVSTIVEYLAEAASCCQGVDAGSEQEFVDRLSAGVERAHQHIIKSYGTKGAPATTLTMVTLLWPRAYFVHVGDSRGYLLRRGRLRQFTADQTMGDFFVDIGKASEEQAKKLGLYDVLSSAVGSDMLPSVGLLDLEPDDALLLCTDGLTKHVPNGRIAELLGAAPSAEAACQSLLDEALAQGGSDNVTVVVGRFPTAAA